MHLNTEQSKINDSHGKVKVTDLLSRINEEKKIEKKKMNKSMQKFVAIAIAAGVLLSTISYFLLLL